MGFNIHLCFTFRPQAAEVQRPVRTYRIRARKSCEARPISNRVAPLTESDVDSKILFDPGIQRALTTLHPLYITLLL